MPIENSKAGIDRMFNEIRDSVLDEYNDGNISNKEMKNILVWCDKMVAIMVERLEEGLG